MAMPNSTRKKTCINKKWRSRRSDRPMLPFCSDSTYLELRCRTLESRRYCGRQHHRSNALSSTVTRRERPDEARSAARPTIVSKL